jgi:hypothetical protein
MFIRGGPVKICLDDGSSLAYQADPPYQGSKLQTTSDEAMIDIGTHTGDPQEHRDPAIAPQLQGQVQSSTTQVVASILGQYG